MASSLTQSDRYAVEVSGWNRDENFFVEQTELEWSEAVQTIRLRHALRERCLIFIRLLGYGVSAKESEPVPVAYEAIRVEYSPEERRYEVALSKIKPKAIADAQVHVSNETTQGVLQ
jgi:hypothetical protein